MKKDITIVGAGLVGSLCALYMTKRGHKVNIFERRKDLRSEIITVGKSINLALSERGCQISVRVKNGNKELFDIITEKGVIADWREPDVIRVAPVPLYNSFLDVFNFYNILKAVI